MNVNVSAKVYVTSSQKFICVCNKFFFFLINVKILQTDYTVTEKNKLFGYPPPPAPNFWKLEEKFLLYKSILHLIFRIPKKVFFLWEFWSLKIYFKFFVVNLFTFLHWFKTNI